MAAGSFSNDELASAQTSAQAYDTVSDQAYKGLCRPVNY
jgi:hypothetical protein